MIVLYLYYLDKLEKNSNNFDNNINLFSYNKGKKENNLSITKINRLDAKGVSIIKGQKKHSLTFCDLIGKKSFAEIVDVESYKKYNTDMSSLNDEPGCTCKCLII